MTEQAVPSDAILTVPNLLTLFRLALIPLFLYLALGLENIGAAVFVAIGGFMTDLVDGRIARRFGQVSRLGIALDPLSDRLGLAAGAAVLIVKDLAPLWVVLVVIGRDALFLLVGAPILKARHLPIPPVTRVGKYGSFAVSVMFGLFLASGVHSVVKPSGELRAAGWIFAAVGVPMYYASGVGYIRAGIRSMRADREVAGDR